MLWKSVQRARTEEAFTLVELITIFVIIGLLATFAIPAFGQVHRQAVGATVKSDIRNSVNAVLEKSDSMLKFTTPEHFDKYATTTEGNTVTLWVDGTSKEVACIWGTHVFEDSEVISYYWSSESGRIGDGSCIGEDAEVATGGYEDPTPGDEGTGPDTHTDPTPPGNSNPTPSNPVVPPVVENPPAGVILTPTAPPLAPGEVLPDIVPGVTTPPSSDNTSPTPPGTGTTPIEVNVPVTTDRNKFPVCHQNESDHKKYHLLMLPLTAILHGHAGIHHHGGGDVIPPISHGRFEGQNWDSKGKVIFTTHCS